MNNLQPITLVGIGDDGCVGLTSRAVNAVESVGVLAGAERHLAFFPQFRGDRLMMKGGLDNYLNKIAEAAEAEPVCVLASGDPLFFGLGERLEKKVGAKNLRIIPSVSSVQQAFARLAIPWGNTQVISIHGRPMHGLVTRLQHGNTFALLTDKQHHPVAVAKHLLKYGEDHWQIHLCEALGGTDEKISHLSVAELAEMHAEEIHHLNVLVLVRGDTLPWGGLPQHCDDDSYQKRTPAKGLITKQPVRALALAYLNISPSDCVWDIGAGSGSVAIEAAKQAWKGAVYAVECNEDCFELIEENTKNHKTDNLDLIKSRAETAINTLPAPDAVFIGGSRGGMREILTKCWSTLKPGGRIVISTVTLESITEAFELCKSMQLNPEILMTNISTSVPLAHYTRFQAENPIHLFVISKPFTHRAATHVK